MSKLLGVDHCPDVLRRTSATLVFSGLTAQQRRKEIQGSVVVRSSRAHYLAGRHVLLVDDFMVTGATLSECAQVCLNAGAVSVSIVTLAVAAKDV